VKNNESFESIEVHPTPAMKSVPGGRWERVWTVLLKEEIYPEVHLGILSSQLREDINLYLSNLFMHKKLEVTLAQDDLLISLELDGRKLSVITNMGERAAWDEFWIIAPLYLLVRIDREIRKIDQIIIDGEGYDIELYGPWRIRKAYLGDEKYMYPQKIERQRKSR
jgi:hypothetical protein